MPSTVRAALVTSAAIRSPVSHVAFRSFCAGAPRCGPGRPLARSIYSVMQRHGGGSIGCHHGMIMDLSSFAALDWLPISLEMTVTGHFDHRKVVLIFPKPQCLLNFRRY